MSRARRRQARTHTGRARAEAGSRHGSRHGSRQARQDREDTAMAWTDKRRTPSDYIERHKAARVLAAHGYVCHLCGHEGGVLDVDHVIPWAEWTHPTMSVHDASNLAPAHSAPCPTCGRECHTLKSKDEASRGRARGNAARAAKRRRPTEKHPGLI